ncbi:hypothetical protein [Arthrobacter burdickii]|uniref:hypothetical protein n=1 Tax=Arthrobacter burdickii TaxID=3035920 RepID=UPI00342C0F0D
MLEQGVLAEGLQGDALLAEGRLVAVEELFPRRHRGRLAIQVDLLEQFLLREPAPARQEHDHEREEPFGSFCRHG